MGVTIKGVLKDNQKLLLSVLGVLVMVVFMASASGSGILLDSIEPDGLGGDRSGVVVDGNTRATPVSNGKNGIYRAYPANQLQPGKNYSAVIETSMGNITVDLYEDRTPLAVNSFVFLSEGDFYAGTSFHRVIKDFVIQGGDPAGTGAGGPGYLFNDEIVGSIKFEPYVLAMANDGANRNGSQFFITTRNSTPSYLDGKHTIFGKVVSGTNVVDNIENVDVDSVNYDKMPVNSVIIKDIRIIVE